MSGRQGWREGWLEEKRSAHLYAVLAESERDPRVRDLWTGLARAAEAQAGIWAEQARGRGERVPERYEPELRVRIVARLVRRYGARRMRHVLAASKVRGLSVYRAPAKGHHPLPTSVEQLGRRHQSAGTAGNLRAAVFGVNDGLVSNASLVLGVAGAAGDDFATVLLAGTAGMLAGAFSMASGEYVSVRSQREMFEHQIAAERAELAEYPEAEAAELALIYEARGILAAEARRAADEIVRDPERALDTLAREELGLDPEELGSPWGAAASSFASFVGGAVVPLVPFFAGASAPLFVSIGLTAVALFGVGATMSLFTGRNAFFSGGRMLLVGALAGAATYGIGRLFGVALG